MQRNIFCVWVKKEVTLIREVVCESFHSLTHRNTRWKNSKNTTRRIQIKPHLALLLTGCNQRRIYPIFKDPAPKCCPRELKYTCCSLLSHHGISLSSPGHSRQHEKLQNATSQNLKWLKTKIIHIYYSCFIAHIEPPNHQGIECVCPPLPQCKSR